MNQYLVLDSYYYYAKLLLFNSPFGIPITPTSQPTTRYYTPHSYTMRFSKPDTKNDENLPVRLILCLDGTGDTADGAFSAVGGKAWNLTRFYWLDG